MKFTLYAFAAATAFVAQTNAVDIEDEELSNEVLFPQVAALMSTMSDSDLNEIEHYMAQVHSQSEDDQAQLLAQIEVEDNDLAILGNYLAQLSGEELSNIADIVREQHAAKDVSFAQTEVEIEDVDPAFREMYKMAPRSALHLSQIYRDAGNL